MNDFPFCILAINISLVYVSASFHFEFNMLSMHICGFIMDHLKSLLKRGGYKITNNSRVTKRWSSGTKPPSFKSQLHNIGALHASVSPVVCAL
jgi:hypothetical protein